MTEMDNGIAPEKRSFRMVAFLGIACSTSAVTACLIAFPLVFHYVQLLHASVQSDLEFCRSRSRDMWKGVLDVQENSGASAQRIAKAIELLSESDPDVFIDYDRLSRVARRAPPIRRTLSRSGVAAGRQPAANGTSQTSSVNRSNLFVPSAATNLSFRDQPIPVANTPQTTKAPAPAPQSQSRGNSQAGRLFQGGAQPQRPPPGRPIQLPPVNLSTSPVSRGPRECCTCHRGAPGPEGPPGNPGRDGMDGDDGKPGDNGVPATQTVTPEQLFPKQCPCEAEKGEIGPAGNKGPAGPSGPAGPPGDDGKGGDNGFRGEQGKPGQDGKHGLQGPPGDEGPVIPPKELPAGKAGAPGKDGAPGPLGDPGKPGSSGKDAPGGAPGEPGPQGSKGQNGKDASPGLKGPPGEKGSCAHCPPPRLAPGY